MQDTPSDGYTYVITIYGAEAVAKAKQIRTQVVAELAQAEKQLAAATGETLEIISSQTRRLSYNMTRLQDTREAATQLADAWLRTLQIISKASDGAFDVFVQDALEAYNEVAGHSYFSDIYYAFKRMVANIAQESEGAFEPLVQEAAEAAQNIQGRLDAQGTLRFPSGAAVQGVSIAGREATPETIAKYNSGLLQLNDVMSGIPLQSAAVQQTLKDQGYAVDEASGFWEGFTDQLNIATLQYFGVRRLGYGLEQFGTQLARSGQRNIDMMLNWAQSYVDFNRTATLAAAAMEMNREEQEMLEQTVLGNVEAMRLFDPAETVNGLRIWAAGTGQVVHSQEQLNEMLAQTHDIQILAALGNEQLGETMEYVGAAVAEYGLELDDTDRIAKVFNFTAAKTFAEISDMGNAFKLVGPEADAFGVSLEETSAVLGLLSDRNIKGTMAGRAFRQMLIQLAKPTKQHTELLNDALGLNEALGETWQDLVFPEGQFIGIASYIDLVAAATENMTQQQRNALLATMATANELPALTSLIAAQTEARKDGINVVRAWTKWMVGAVDEEVEAFSRLMRETKGVEVDTATDMYNLWAEQSQLYYDSEAAKAEQLERRWKTMQISLGQIVLEEGAPVIENLIELLEKVVRFAADNPGLVTGFMTAAAVQLVLGNLISVSGQLVGVVANILIMRGAFAGFGGAVGTFQAAVAQFSGAVGVSSTRDVAGDATYGAATFGLAAVLKRLAGAFGIILAVDQPSDEQRVFEDMLEELRSIGGFAEHQWQALMELGVEPIPGVGLSYGRTVGYERMGEELDLQGLLELLEQMNMLTDTQQEFLDGLRSHPVLDVDVEGEIPPELEELLAEIEGGSTWEIEAQLEGLTPQEMEAVGLFNEMTAELEALEKAHGEKMAQVRKDLAAAQRQARSEYLQDIEDITDDFNAKEEEAYRKHMDKLATIRENIQAQMEEELIRLQQRIEEVWIRAGERIKEAEEEVNKKIEEARAEHLKKLRRMEEDHRDKLVDLAIRRDAYGIWKEMRDYKKQVSREKEDFDDRLRSLQENGQSRIDEIKRQAAQEEAELRRSYARRIAELERQLKAQQDKEKRAYERAAKERQKAHKRELDELKNKFERERDERDAAAQQALRDLQAKYKAEYEEIQRSKAIEMAMLRGLYAEQLYDYNIYLQDRLDMLDAFLRAEEALWASYNLTPGGTTTPPTTPTLPPTYPPGVPIPYDMPPVTSPTIVVGGTVAVDVNVSGGDVPDGAVDALTTGVEVLFEQALRRMEVRYD